MKFRFAPKTIKMPKDYDYMSDVKKMVLDLAILEEQNKI